MLLLLLPSLLLDVLMADLRVPARGAFSAMSAAGRGGDTSSVCWGAVGVHDAAMELDGGPRSSGPTFAPDARHAPSEHSERHRAGRSTRQVSKRLRRSIERPLRARLSKNAAPAQRCPAHLFTHYASADHRWRVALDQGESE